MMNLSRNLIINSTGDVLNIAIRKALNESALLLLEVYENESIDFRQVSTHCRLNAAYPLFVLGCVLKSSAKLDEAYLRNAYATFDEQTNKITMEQFEKFTLCNHFPRQQYKKTYRSYVKTGIGIFLVYLHSEGIVTLPSNFNWPIHRQIGVRISDYDQIICKNAELLCFIRSMEVNVDNIEDEAFIAVGTNQNRRQWFRTYATRLVLATGWRVPEDVTYDGLLELKTAEAGGTEFTSVYRTLLDVLKRKYPDRIAISSSDWDNILIEHGHTRKISEGLSNLSYGNSSLTNYLEVVQLGPSLAFPDRLSQTFALPGLDFNMRANTSTWLELYQNYFSVVRREDYSQPMIAIGYFNLYLFYYLPYWFHENPSTNFKFPSTPDDLVGIAFISRNKHLDITKAPYTFVDFMELRREHYGHQPETIYGYLKQVEMFFTYLVTYADELPHCKNFKQPFSKLDFPILTKSQGTNKAKIPRQVFSAMVNYIECVRDYAYRVNQKMLSGEITPHDFYSLTKFNYVINTKQAEEKFKLEIPSYHANDNLLQVEFIPMPISADWYQLKTGQRLKILRPHALNQILVALYTGLRHHHIQWLDGDLFDQFAKDDGQGYTLLHVNTDKANKRQFTPMISMRVIELLRLQRDWRDLIDEPSFNRFQFYNNNKETVYPKFRPLFSCSPKTGLPHSDNTYADAWNKLLLGFQSQIPKFWSPVASPYILCKLRPPGIKFNDRNEWEKLEEFSNLEEGVCPLKVQSEITPHSSRVTVVSEFISYLQPEMIGRYITGQNRKTVFHYVRTEPDDLESLRGEQKHDLIRRAFEQQVRGFIDGDLSSDASFIKPDNINSKLAQSLRTDFDETISRYGCISVTLGEGEVNGIDVIRKRGIGEAAFNKTEICPYSNDCPKEVLLQLKGTRRCSLCSYAVRSIDHLPALVARAKYTLEMLLELSETIDKAEGGYTEQELDMLELERQTLGEDLVGWQFCIETLEMQRIRVVVGDDTRTWVVEKPEIIEQDLQRVAVQTDTTNYILSRIQESIQYPNFQSPSVKAKFDLYRRKILASDPATISEAFSGGMPANPAAECAGVLRSYVAAHKLSIDDVRLLLDTDQHLTGLPNVVRSIRMLDDER